MLISSSGSTVRNSRCSGGIIIIRGGRFKSDIVDFGVAARVGVEIELVEIDRADGEVARFLTDILAS